MTIANVGSGIASSIVLTTHQPCPEIDVAYKDERTIPFECSTVVTGSTRMRVCVLRALPQPGERLQVRYRWMSACADTGATEVRAASPDELPPGNHVVDLRKACEP